MDFGEVTLNGRSAEAGFETRDVDPQWCEGADEQRVPLEPVQPHGGMGIDVLKRARDHLQARVVDLVIGQPLDEDPARIQDPLAERVELPRVEVAVASVLGFAAQVTTNAAKRLPSASPDSGPLGVKP